MSDITTTLSIVIHSSSYPTNIPRIIGSRATDHVICCTSFFSTIMVEVSYSVKLPNGNLILVTHLGTVKITDNMFLINVLCVPSFSFNLIFTRRLTQSLTRCLVFLSGACFIQYLSTWTTIGISKSHGGLYQLLTKDVPPSALAKAFPQFTQYNSIVSSSVINSSNVSDLWHCRLGHISISRLHLITYPIVKGKVVPSNTTCCCVYTLAKQHRVPFSC